MTRSLSPGRSGRTGDLQRRHHPVPDRGGDGSPAGTGAPQRDGSGEVASEEFLHIQSAVLRECIVNLARIKDTIAQNVGGTLDAAGLDAWPELMRGIKAGLLMLGRTRAVAVVESIATCLKRVMQPGGARLAASYLDRLADAIVSVEYYMETLEAGRAEPGYMLDNAQACLDALLAAPQGEAPGSAPTLSPSLPAARIAACMASSFDASSSAKCPGCGSGMTSPAALESGASCTPAHSAIWV